MKKILLTGCAIAFFCVGTIAQIQDTASTNLRKGAVEVQEQTQDQINNTSNELQRSTDQTETEVKQEANEVKEDVNQVKEEAQQTGNEVKQEVEQTGNQVEQGATDVKEKMEQSTDRVKDRASEAKPAASIENNAQPTPVENSAMNSTAVSPVAVEVVEDKEGPNNQVVYKYQDGFYYVDRDKKEFVKIEESQLKDAAHKAIMSDNTSKQN